ncbi:MAG: MFS transporter [Gammaproteobacteria bacterium]|nr:MAG: MFS transporter [Gammaproteobacteria bacterium]
MSDKPNRLGPYWLQPGVTRINMAGLFLSAYTSIGLLTFIAMSTPFVLTVYLQVPQSEQGTLSGDLHFFQEIVALLLFAPVGVLADRIGRREVFVGGMLMMSLGYSLYSFSSSLPELFFYRFLYTIGIVAATGMMGTILADYSEDRSRGMTVASVGVLNALGVITVAVGLARLPQFFTERGASQEAAGHDAHFVVAAICAVAALLLYLMLKKGTPVKHTERPPVKELVASGIREARNPRIALAYACGFIARSDLVLVGTYSVLWGTTAAIAQGMEPAEAMSAGRRVFAIVSTAALFWLPVIGFVLDRINRVTGIILCMTIAAAGYLATTLVDDILANSAIPFLVLLGIGQISAFAGAQTLIAREAPQASRGSVIGMFNMFGAVGILFSTGVGGRVFDALGPAAPFQLVGVLTLVLVMLAVWCRIKAPGPAVDRRAPAVAAIH